MTSAKFSDFLTPSPIVTVTNQLMVFLSSAFWRTHAPPLTHFGRHIRKPPNTIYAASVAALPNLLLLVMQRERGVAK